MIRRSLIAAVTLASVGTACVTVQTPPPQPPALAVGAAPSQAVRDSSTSDTAKTKNGYTRWAEATKDARRVDGFLQLYQKREKLYLAIHPERLERDFLLVIQLSQGIGDLGLDGGASLTSRLVRFRRATDHVEVVLPNPYVRADSGSPMARAVDLSFGPSVIASLKIESEDDSTGTVLVEIGGFLESDLAGLAGWLQFALRTGTSLDQDASRVVRIANFPENTEFDVQLTYRPGQPRALATVPDARWITFGVHYSFSDLPTSPMEPRLADDRVGYFVSAQRDFSRDTAETFFVRYIDRWRLEPRDRAADVWEPETPITYYLDRTVPERWRPYVRAGVLEWNRAFENAGWRNAIRVVDAPSDTSWSAEDARFSTIRWIATRQGAYAVGPSTVDPRTGEILNADILVTASVIQAWQGEYRSLAAPTDRARALLAADSLIRRDARLSVANRLCSYAGGLAARTSLVRSALVGAGVMAAGETVPDTYIGQALKELIMHEVGHTLGLRHNFRGSSGVPTERLHDRAYTAERGMSLSVMDYNPPNVALHPNEQGDFYSATLGPYDYWAIEYGYAHLPSADKETALRAIARRAAEPDHLYGSDEDTGFGPFALDPTITAWDLGADPLAWARRELRVIDVALDSADARLIGPGDSYAKLRSGVSELLFQKWFTLLVVQKQIAGSYTSRDHKGDPGERPAFQVVAGDRQREALQILLDEGFAENAFSLSPDLLNKLAPERWLHWDANPFFSMRIDFPYLQTVGFYQAILLEFLHDPAVLARMRDAELRVASLSETLTIPELFSAVANAVWSEVRGGSSSPITSTRRDLQRFHLNTLTRIMVSPPPGMPEDARSVARGVLSDLAGMLRGARRDDMDAYTRAHLDESQVRIDRILAADYVVTTSGTP